jgi:hypothetical protein
MPREKRRIAGKSLQRQLPARQPQKPRPSETAATLRSMGNRSALTLRMAGGDT